MQSKCTGLISWLRVIGKQDSSFEMYIRKVNINELQSSDQVIIISEDYSQFYISSLNPNEWKIIEGSKVADINTHIIYNIYAMINTHPEIINENDIIYNIVYVTGSPEMILSFRKVPIIDIALGDYVKSLNAFVRIIHKEMRGNNIYITYDSGVNVYNSETLVFVIKLDKLGG